MADFLVNLRIRAFESVSAVTQKVRKELAHMGHLAEEAKEKLHGAADLKQTAEAVGELGAHLREMGAELREPLMEGAAAFGRLKAAITQAGVVSGATDEQMNQMIERSALLGRTTSISTEQVASGFKALGESGLDAESQLATIEPTLKLAAVSGMAMGEAGALAGNLMKRFGLSAEKLPETLDVVAATARAAHVSIGDMASSLAVAAPNASRFGVSVEQVAVLSGALAQAGVHGEEAGSTISSMITKLAAARKLGAKGLSLLGINTTDAKTGQLKTIPALLQEITDKTANMGAKKREKFIQGIFGPEAAKSVGKLMSSLKGGELEKMAAAAEHAGGTLQDMFGKTEETKKGDRLTNAVHGLEEELGKGLTPVIGKAKSFLIKLLTGITDWIEHHPTLTKVIVYTVAAVSALLTVLGVFLGLIAGALMTAITVMAVPAVISMTTAMISLAASVAVAPFVAFAGVIATGATGLWAMVAPALALAAPFIALAAAVGAVGLAIYELHKHWDELNAAEGFSGIWDMFKEQGAIGTGLGLLGLNDVSQKGETFNEKTGQWEATRVDAATPGKAGGRGAMGGKLHIKIDSEGRPKIESLESDGGLGLDVDAGHSTVGT